MWKHKINKYLLCFRYNYKKKIALIMYYLEVTTHEDWV